MSEITASAARASTIRMSSAQSVTCRSMQWSCEAGERGTATSHTGADAAASTLGGQARGGRCGLHGPAERARSGVRRRLHERRAVSQLGTAGMGLAGLRTRVGVWDSHLKLSSEATLNSSTPVRWRPSSSSRLRSTGCSCVLLTCSSTVARTRAVSIKAAGVFNMGQGWAGGPHDSATAMPPCRQRAQRRADPTCAQVRLQPATFVVPPTQKTPTAR